MCFYSIYGFFIFSLVYFCPVRCIVVMFMLFHSSKYFIIFCSFYECFLFCLSTILMQANTCSLFFLSMVNSHNFCHYMIISTMNKYAFLTPCLFTCIHVLLFLCYPSIPQHFHFVVLLVYNVVMISFSYYVRS